MRLEFEPNTSASVPFVEKDVVTPNAASEVENLLRDGVRAAQEGRRGEARNLLLRVTETDADNENAWLWLASISEYPEELLVFLNNVLRINSENERALEWHKATNTLLAKTLVQRGMDAANDNRKDFARQCFEQALEHEAENEMAWLWMASVADSDDEKTAYFEKILSINPENESAKASLESIQSQKTQKMFEDALAAAFDGRHNEAKDALEGVLAQDAAMEDAWVLKSHLAASFEERGECFLKILALNPENEMAKASLASWRMLSEKLPEQSETQESAEMVAESEPETAFFEQAENVETETAENVASSMEEFAEAESPTQELALDADYQEPEQANFDEPQPEENQLAEEEQSSASFGAEFEAEEVSFESEENQETQADLSDDDEHLKSALEAEEAEMNWAFTTSEEPAQAEDYFRNNDADDDIHKTQQANYESEDFPESFSNQVEEQNEDWRDTSPGVFANYSPDDAPENSFDAPTVQFTYTENPVAEENAEEQASMRAEETAEPQAEEKSQRAETVLCPFCDARNDKQAFACGSCQTVLTLSDLEMLLASQAADEEKLSRTVESLERENESYGLNAEQMMNLGVGHINLKNYRQGFHYLQEAVRMNPSNVLLDAQVNALAIRLSEMEEQQTAHDSMAKNRKILVVDDSPTVRKLISGKLEKCGHEVVCAVDGVDALEKINDLKPDLVLLDITMPRMDGYQVCKLIRGNETTKDVPVVMISGKDGFFDKVRGRMAGTSGYITKPFGPETLMKTVETYLN